MLSIRAIVIGTLLAATSAVASGAGRGPVELAKTLATTRGLPQIPEEFGTQYVVTSVFAGALTQEDSAFALKTNPNGYRYLGSGSAHMLGSVSVPSGVIIDFIGMNSCDVPGNSFTLFLFDATTGSNSSLVGAILSTASPACGFDSTAAPIGHLYPSNAGHHLEIWIYQADSAPTNGTAGVQSIEVWWRRQVSPAPPSPTFADVPASDFGYQYIEALAASGITGGCGGGKYCPDASVTRRQMAIFFSKALGLHWPD